MRVGGWVVSWKTWKKFEKTLDKKRKLWYNKGTKEIRKQQQVAKNKIKKFEKTLDKQNKVWYNKGTKRK